MLLKRLRRFLAGGHDRSAASVAGDFRLTFFGGKGGVGKTTCAAAWAVLQAERGRSVLLISTDPAHSLGDLLERAIGDKPVPIRECLSAMELSPDAALRTYLREVKANLRELAAPELRTAAEAQAELAGRAPGALDAALFEAMVRVMLDLGPHHDELVFDTAPTGQTLQLLALPEVMGAWSEGMLARRREARAAWLERAPEADPPEDRAAAILDARRRRYEQVRALLKDHERFSFIPVLNPDALSLEETRRMTTALEAAGIAVPALIVNRVVPESAQGEFAAALRATQRQYLEAIDTHFAARPRVRIAHRSSEIRGLVALSTLATELCEAAVHGAA